jgi:hypothetical protein
MQRYVEIHGVKQPLFGANDLEAPALPVLAGADHFLSQLPYGLKRFQLRRFEIRNLDPRIIKDRLVIAHKVEETAHLKPA